MGANGRKRSTRRQARENFRAAPNARKSATGFQCGKTYNRQLVSGAEKRTTDAKDGKTCDSQRTIGFRLVPDWLKKNKQPDTSAGKHATAAKGGKKGKWC